MEVRGLGLFRAVEFREVGKHSGQIGKEVAETAPKRGLADYLCSSAVDAVMLAPPFVSDEGHVKRMARILGKAVRDVLERKGIASE